MTKTFFERVTEYLPLSHGAPSGYSTEEIEVLERVYAFRAVGMLREFLMSMGRSAGGVLCRDESLLYFSEFDLRDHLIFQYDFVQNLRKTDNHDHIEMPFVFGLLAETQYCFVKTSSDDADLVYIFDSNEGVVTSTEQNLVSFLRSLVVSNMQYGLHEESGDLLRL